MTIFMTVLAVMVLVLGLYQSYHMVVGIMFLFRNRGLVEGVMEVYGKYRIMGLLVICFLLGLSIIFGVFYLAYYLSPFKF